jgi:hypothetical protein
MIRPLTPPSPSPQDHGRNRAYCDLCGQSEHDEHIRADPSGTGWSPDANRVSETHISWLDGHWERADLSVGRVKRVEYHVCPTCFRTKLMPWFRSQGAKPSIWRHDSDDAP